MINGLVLSAQLITIQKAHVSYNIIYHFITWSGKVNYVENLNNDSLMIICTRICYWRR